MSFSPGVHASAPDVGVTFARASFLVTAADRCAPLCGSLASLMMSCEVPENAREICCEDAAAQLGVTFAETAARWDAAPVVAGRPLLEALARERAAGHAHADQLADAVVRLESLSHVSLVWHQASKVAPSFPGYGPSDLVGWGWAGLRMALRRFDPSLGYAFSTYACTRIVGAMRDGVRAERPIPKRLGTFQRRLDQVAAELEESLGRAPTSSELAESVGETADKVLAAQRARPSVSLDEMLLSGKHLPVFDAVPEQPSPEIEKLFEVLTAREAQVLRMVVLEGMSDPEVAKSLSVSSSTVRKLRSSALERLRSELV